MDQIHQEVGIKPPFAFEAFPDLEQDLRQSIARIRASPSFPTATRSTGSSTTCAAAGWNR
jgi:carbonic anhydrase